VSSGTPQASVVDFDARSLAEGERYAQSEDAGLYLCVNCSNPLYDSDDKITTNAQRAPTFRASRNSALKYTEDYSYGLPRQIASCTKCGQLTGHVYNRGTKRERHSAYSASLSFVVAESSGDEESGRDSDEVSDEVSDSGSLTLNAAASFQSALIAGVVNAQAALALTNLTLAGGTLSGPGTTAVSGKLWIATSDTGNTNNFLSSTLILYGNGQASVPIYLLLGAGGQFHIAQGGTFNILSSFNFGIQAGKPLVVIDGTLTASPAATQTIISNVDISGAGAFKLNAGSLVTNGDTFTIGQLVLAVSTKATLNTVVFTAGSVTGAGSLNLTAAPSPVSSITNAAVTYLGIVNGAVNIGSFAVTTFEFWSGTVTLASSSTNTATTFDFYGGSLAGTAKLTTTAFNLNLRLPASISGTAIKTTALTITSSGNGSIQLSNGATIVADSSSYQTRSGVVIA